MSKIQRKHCFKFNENSKTFHEIIELVRKDNGEKYAHASGVKGTYNKALAKIFKNITNFYGLNLSNSEIYIAINKYEVQKFIYDLVYETSLNDKL